MSRCVAAIVLLVSVWVAALPVGAAVEVSFPLGEHYRVGRYLPVRVAAKDFDGPLIWIESDGAVRTEVQLSGGRADRTIPFLSVTPLGAVRWTAGPYAAASTPITHTLRPLADDERLIGATVVDEALAAELFPSKRVRWLTLDFADPLPGPPAAWEALDAVLLDEASAARVTGAHVLVDAGTAVAVRAKPRPSMRWAWREHGGGWWVALADVAGPRSALAPEAYEPVSSWRPGWSGPARWGTVLVLVAFSLAAVGATLFRSRNAWVGVVAASAVGAGAIAWWWGGQAAVRVALGSITVRGPDAQQNDTWTYHATLKVRAEWSDGLGGGFYRPVFASRGHLHSLDVRIVSEGDRDDGIQVAFALRRGQRLACLGRLGLYPPPDPTHGYYPPASSSPLESLARSSYLSSGDRVVAYRYGTSRGRAGQWDDKWADVVIDRPGYPPPRSPTTPTPATATSPEAPPR